MSNLPDESTIASLEGMGYTPERIREIYANNNEGDILQEGIYNAPKIIKGLRGALGGRMVESAFRIPKQLSDIDAIADVNRKTNIPLKDWQKMLPESMFDKDMLAKQKETENKAIIAGNQRISANAQKYNPKIDIGTQMIQEADPGFAKESNARFLYDNLFSLGDSLQTIAFGHLTGGLATLPLMGLRKSADTSDELKRKGIDPRTADEIGIKSGINEIIGEAGTVALLYGKLPLKWVATKLPDKVMSYISPTIKNISRGILGYITELFGENVTEVLDRKLQNNLINPNYSIQDAINEVLRDTSFQKGLAFQSAGFALLAGGQGYVNKFGDFLDKKIGESETIKKMADYIAPSPEQLMQRYKEAGIDPSRRFRERGQIDFFRGGTKKYPKFSEKYIGEGEGAAAFGWGVNVSEEIDVAKRYAVAREAENSLDDVLVKGKPSNWVSDNSPYTVDVLRDLAGAAGKVAFERIKQDRINVLNNRKNEIPTIEIDDENINEYFDAEILALKDLKFGDVTWNEEQKAKIAKGKLFPGLVRGKDYQIMPWDKEISDEQYKIINEGLKKIPIYIFGEYKAESLEELLPEESEYNEESPNHLKERLISYKGKDIYEALVKYFHSQNPENNRLENQMLASKWLNNIGIHGNEAPVGYLSRGGRQTEKHNYFIFDSRNVQIDSWWDIMGNQIGSIMVYGDDKEYLGSRMYPSLGKHFNDVNPQHGDKWTIQYANGEPFEVNILGQQGEDVLADVDGSIKRFPIDKVQFVKRTGDHYIPRLYTGPLSKDIVTENPDTLYVALSYGDRDAKLIGENVTAIDINERAMINQLTPEEMKLFIASKGKFDWRYAAIDKEVDRIKKLATGLQTQAETYTYRVTPKTYDRLISNIATYNQAYLDKKGGVVEVPEGLVYKQEFTETKTTKDPETDKDIFSLKKREKASYEFGAGIGEVVKIESAGREPLLLQVESTKPSQYKGQLTYILKPFVRKPAKRFTDVVVPEVMGRTNYINIKNSDPMLYKYLYQKMHELNSFVNRTKGLQTPKTITYAGREVAVNGLETFTSKGIPIYNTEYGLMTGEGEIVRTPEEITNKPKKTIWVTPGDTIKSNEALLKPTVSVEDLKVGDVISLENYSQFKTVNAEGKYYKQTPGSELKIKGGKTVEKFPKMKPVHVRITRKIDYVKDLLNLQKTEDERGRQTFIPTNKELANTMTSKLGKNDKFLGTYFRPDNKIGQFYPGRSPYTYIEYELVQEKPKEKQTNIPEFITRSFVRNNPDLIFLFGDNLQQSGYGGQAKEMRGEPNAIGIPTKKKPSMSNDSFMTDEEYETNIKAIDAAFEKIPEGVEVVIPNAGLGTGLAELDKRAPRTFKYLQNKLQQYRKPKEKPTRRISAKIGTPKAYKTLNQILSEAAEEPKFVYEPMGENELKDEDFGSWRHEVTEEINLQLSGVKGNPFTEWSNNLSEATRIKDNAKIAQLIQEGKAFMDEDKVVRMVESLERKYGMMPFQMSFVEYANTQGAELNIVEETAERPKYTPKEVSLQWGMNPTPPTKETRFPVMLPTGKAKVEGYGDVTYTLPYGEQEIENEPSIRGYREVVISSPDVSTMYFEHLESCVDALSGGWVGLTSDIAKRMFYEHPELLQTEYAAPYKAELMARVKLLANAEKVKAELLAMKKEDRVLHPAISKMIAEGAKGVSDAAASIRENQEVGTTVEQTEQKQQDLKKEAKDMDSGEGLVSSLIDTFTEIFTDETGAFGNLGPAAPGFEKLRAWLAVPGNKFRMKYMSNNEPTPLGIKRQKFETAMAICRNNIDRLSDLANSVGQNSKPYFEAILRSKGFSPQDASFLADEFHKQVFPRLVLGAQNKAIQTSMLKESHKRKPGYTTKEAMQSSAKKFWKEKMVEPVKEFLKTVDMIISGTREKTVSQGKHGLKFFPYVPPEMRTWLREFESQLPRHIKAQLMTVDQILFARMDEIEKQLVTDYIEAAENLQTFRHDNLYMRTQYILDGHTEEQANDYMLRLETMLLNEVYGKANEIGQRNENSINNIFHSISQYKVLCARNFDELQRRGKVAPWQRRDFYIHHQVLEYSEEWFIDKVTMRPSKISKKPIRGYSEQRGLSEKEHQEAKPESLIASIMNPWIDNLLEDAMNDILTKYDKTYEFITSNLVLGKNYTMVPNKMLDKVINRDGGNRFALTPEEAQKTEKKQCAWLKEGAEVDINGTPYIAVAKTYYTLKFDHDPVSGYRIMDGSQETWLIPKSVNDAINSLTDRGDGLGAKLMRGANTLTRLFKRTAIMTVWPVFQMTNMIGDTLQIALLAENRADIIRHLPFTLKYVSRKWLEAVSNGKYVPKLTEREARIEDWMDRKGIIDSDSMAELMKGKYSKAEWVIQLLEQSGTARENVLRVALAASLYDQLMDGTPEQINKIIQKYDWITYSKEATTWEDKLANIARTLCIDYMRQSDFYRKTVSGMGLPFGHWFLQSSWLTAKKIKSHPHMIGALMLPALFAVAWNYSDPEREKAEKNAPIGIRNKFHLFYKWGDEMKLLAPQLPYDSLPIINLPSVFTYSVARMLNGEISPEELPKEFFKQGVNTNSEMFRRLLHPITRWVNGMFIHQDPNDRAQVYPEDLKELSDTDAAKYAFYFFMKCNAPFFGNYISRNYMKRQTTDWMDMVESWYKPMKWAGFRDELPAGVGVEVPTGNKSILGGLLRGDTTSSKFSGQDIIEVEEKLAQETGSIRRDLVSKFEMYPIGKDSVAIQNKAMDKALGELRKLYPNETYPQIVGIFMENVQKRLKTPKAARTMLNNALEYVKDHEEEAKQMGIDKNSLKEIIVKNNERVFVDTIKRIRKEARQELPFIINNIMQGNPSKGNTKSSIIEGYTPNQNSEDDLINSYMPKQ